MKVNMTPNPLDVVTIHASQGDSEARQWEFELHNNGELIDTSEVTEQMFFKSYKGGTEQILPENTSTPTTSPFKGDIRYPQGLLTDQEFLYRQSPTESDGLAKITDIKGNTLVWNQLVQNGNFADTSNWSVGSLTTFTVANNIATFTVSENQQRGIFQSIPLVNNHKYIFIAEVKSANLPQANFIVINGITTNFNITSSFAKYKVMFTYSGSLTNDNFYIRNTGIAGSIDVKNVNIFDLTQMGLDSITDPSEFTSLFPLSYYSYNQGSLLSFNGNGIKTTGKNLLKTNISTETINGVTFTVNKDENGELTEVIVSGTATQRANFYVLPQGTNNVLSTGRYILSCGFGSQNIYMSSYNTTTGLSYRDYGSGVEVPYVTGEDYSIYITVLAGATANNFVFKPMLRLIDVEDSTFEPYTSSTLSLPISTYFPTGMKSAGNVYDELTESKAITRVGQITINGSYDVYLTELTDCVRISLEHGRTDVKYPNPVQASNYLPFLVNFSQDSEHFYMNGASAIIFILKSKCGTTAESVKAYLNSNPLTVHYELATPTETQITTEDANEALSLLMGKSVSSNNAKQMIDIITKGE